jgi:hypothetical protein
MVDVNRIALYLAWNFPPYYKPFEKGFFIELLILNSGWTLDDAKVATLNQQSSNDQQFFSMCLSRLERYDSSLVSALIEQLKVPEDVIWFPVAWVSITQSLEAKVEELNKIVNEVTKPLLITEWKTDRDIITIARTKLHPDEEMPFEVVSSGTKQHNWSANVLKNQLQHLSESVLARYKTIIWVFDNDKEGNDNFWWLNNDFEEEQQDDVFLRKHVINNVYWLLLPVPKWREKYISWDKNFVIEFYFDDEVLRENKILWNERIEDSGVFQIWNWKTRFVRAIKKLSESAFTNFHVLFNEILSLID